MPRHKTNIDDLINKMNIDVHELYNTYMHDTGRSTAKRFNLISEAQIIRILEEKGFDITQRKKMTKSEICAERYIYEKNIDIDALYQAYQHNGLSYVSRLFDIDSGTIKRLLQVKGYDLNARDPIEKLENKNGYAVSELVRNNGIDVQDLYETYLNNGGLYTAHKFGLSNFRLVERILKEYGYDFSNRDIKSINYHKTMATIKERYGVDSALSIPESKQKLIETNRARYGSDYYIGTQEFKEKSIATNLKKYGYKWSTQSPEVKLRHDAANYEKYGVKDFKQRNASEELKLYLNDKEASIQFLQDKHWTFHDLKQHFSTDSESQLTIWLTRFDLFDLLLHYRSTPELEVADYLSRLGFNVTNSRRLLGNGQEIDIYNPELKIGIEFNGTYFHSTKMLRDKNYHFNKSKLAQQKGIRLIHIYEDEWQNPQKQQKIKSLINIACGNVSDKIYARNCEIREITNKEAKPFNEANHLQGHRNAQVTYGLFYKDELVQLMSFSKTKYNRNLKTENSWEIIRGCPGSNNIVVGGVSKLFKHFVKEHNPEKVFSYCDFNKFDGKGYEAIGMKFIGYTGPNKWWIIRNHMVDRSPHKYHELKKQATACIWGAGSKKYEWTNPNSYHESNNSQL